MFLIQYLYLTNSFYNKACLYFLPIRTRHFLSHSTLKIKRLKIALNLTHLMFPCKTNQKQQLLLHFCLLHVTGRICWISISNISPLYYFNNICNKSVLQINVERLNRSSSLVCLRPCGLATHSLVFPNKYFVRA